MRIWRQMKITKKKENIQKTENKHNEEQNISNIQKQENKDTKPQPQQNIEEKPVQRQDNRPKNQQHNISQLEIKQNLEEKPVQRQDNRPKNQPKKQQTEEHTQQHKQETKPQKQIDPFDIPMWYIRDQKGNEIGPFSSREMESELQKSHFSIEQEIRKENENYYTKLGDLFIKDSRNPFTHVALNDLIIPNQFKESLFIYYESKTKRNENPPEPIYGPVIGSSGSMPTPPPQIYRLPQETVDPLKFFPGQPNVYKGSNLYHNLQQLQQHQIKMKQLYQTLMNQYNYPNKLDLKEEESQKNLNRGVFKIDENSGVPTQQVKNNNQQQLKQNNPKQQVKESEQDKFENSKNRSFFGMAFGSTDSL